MNQLFGYTDGDEDQMPCLDTQIIWLESSSNTEYT